MPLLIVVLIISSIVRSNNQILFVGNCLAAACLTILILFPNLVARINKRFIDKIPTIGLCLLSLQLFVHSWVEGGDVRQMIMSPPQPERYAHDTKVFLRTYYLMNGGVSYHRAMADSYDQDTRTKGNPPDLWGFRLPTVFYFWQVVTFKQPLGIYIWFIVMSIGILFLSHQIMTQFTSPTTALLAPVLILPYLVMGATTPELLQMEWWGILPLFVCIWGIFTKKPVPIYFGAMMAVLCRETYALPIAGLFLAAILSKNITTLKSIALAGITTFLLFLLQFQAVAYIMPLSTSQIFTGRQHALTLEFVRQVLAYATQRYMGAPYKLFSLYIVMATIFACLSLLKNKRIDYRYITLLLPIYISLIAFIRIGLCCWSDYWGVMIGPLLCLITAIIVGLQLPHKKNI